ncbi:MAG: hypothetical protein M0Q88_03090 [Bacilli bacterium]|nr:hypothetical protein [Bacilli bacterium]
MECPNCNNPIGVILGDYVPKNVVQYYPEFLYECQCGTIINDDGEDKTEEYYR